MGTAVYTRPRVGINWINTDNVSRIAIEHEKACPRLILNSC